MGGTGKSLTQIKGEIADELGVDAWHALGDGRHQIPEALVIAIATACACEFFKSLTDVKTLGEAARRWISETSHRLRTGSGLEFVLDTGELEALVARCRLDVRAAADKDAALAKATADLTQALIEFGIAVPIAKEHADRISILLWRELLTD